jgi:hypothetical protein
MSSVAMRQPWTRCAECGGDLRGQSVCAGCLCDRCTDVMIAAEMVEITDEPCGQAFPDCWECVLCGGAVGCCYCDTCIQVRQSPQGSAGCEFCPTAAGGCAACRIAAPAGWDYV